MPPLPYPGLRTRRDSDVVVFCGDACERSGSVDEISASRVPAAVAAAPEDGGAAAAAAAPQPPAADGAAPPLLPEDADDLVWEPAAGRRCEARYLASTGAALMWQHKWFPGVITAVDVSADPPPQ